MEKAAVEFLKVKMLVVPGLIRLNSAARREMMYSYICLFCFFFFLFFFAHWHQAGKFLETPLTSLTADFKYRPQSVKLKKQPSKALLWTCVAQFSWHCVCLTPHADIMRCSGFDLTTKRGTGMYVWGKKNQMSAELSSDQTSCSNW